MVPNTNRHATVTALTPFTTHQEGSNPVWMTGTSYDNWGAEGEQEEREQVLA